MHFEEPAKSGSADDYDQLPYVSLPLAYAQPARIAAHAALFGLAAPAVEHARVLEIGAASGGNIIPLAARFPHARFLGLDLSARHVAIGRRRIAALGLSNIELRQGDLRRFDAGSDRFDYVICHGVYSWVPPDAQDAILRILNRVLADDGMAAISYNVLPGWHLRSVVRDIALTEAGTSGGARTRVAKVREILAALAEATRGDDSYGRILQHEARGLARQPASYILGELLAEHNAPCHFQEFAARAAAQGLGYVCEGDLPSSLPELHAPKAAQSIRARAGEDRLAAQHYVDVFSGRTFRRSLLARADRVAAGAERPATARLGGLHIASQLTLEPHRTTADAATFKDHRGQVFSVRPPCVQAALRALAERFPATAAVDMLSRLGTPADDAKVRQALLRLVATGRATLSTVPLAVGRAGDERPLAWSLARLEVAEGQPWVTGLRHTGVVANPVLATLLPWIDGTHDRQRLASRLDEALRAGKVRVDDLPAGAGVHDAAIARENLLRHVDRALAYLEVNAVLVARGA